MYHVSAQGVDERMIMYIIIIIIIPSALRLSPPFISSLSHSLVVLTGLCDRARLILCNFTFRSKQILKGHIYLIKL